MPKLKKSSNKKTPFGQKLGILSLAMLPLSAISFAGPYIIALSAPVGIVSGIVAVKKKHKALGATGAFLNAVMLVSLVLIYVIVAQAKND